MRRRASILQRTLRLHAPLVALFALTLLAVRAPGGVGFVAGLVMALAFALHGLIAGAGATLRALPAPVARALMAIGALLIVAGASAPRWSHAPQLVEAGSFFATVAAASIVMIVVFGRAPTLKEGAW